MDVTAAVIREQSGRFHIEELELDDPRPNEVVVRIAGVGICHTDIICRDQYYPIPMPVVFGHEGSGVVEKVGSAVTKVEVGDHVVLSYLSCGHCHPCQEGKSVYCLELFPLNFACTRDDGSTTLSKGEEVVHGISSINHLLRLTRWQPKKILSKCRKMWISNYWVRWAVVYRPAPALS